MRRSTTITIALGASLLAGAVRAGEKPGGDEQPFDFGALQRRYVETILPALEAGRRPEVADQLMFILFSNASDPVPGWYGPCRTRYDWIWLASRFDHNRDGRVLAGEYRGPSSTWECLDADRDGAITPADLDWSDESPRMRSMVQARGRFRAIDADRDGILSPAELSSYFAGVAAEDGTIDLDRFSEALYADDAPASFERREMPRELRADRLTGILKGDVGSFNEGPELGELAPDFTLRTQDGTQEVTLSSYRGKTPVVLTFGSFTCPPYRSLFPGHGPVRARYGDRVAYFGIYVREAHPTDGWRIASNVDQFALAQPTSMDERLTVARRFCEYENPTFPILVDEMDDAVGHAYSGMPNRMYIIDRDGRVAYKSGRGPKGYKVAEMEQALAMLLLDLGETAESAASGDAAGAD